MRSWIRWSAWICLSLMLWTTAVESIHSHPGPNEAATCSICVVAHTASPAVNAVHSTPFFSAVGIFHEEEFVANARLDFADLGIRGPPAVL